MDIANKCRFVHTFLDSKVSEIRSSLKHFTDIVQVEQKGPSFVQSFSDRLKCVRRDLNTLSAEGENLKGTYNLKLRNLY